jgi:hypothetical protein
MAINIRSTPSFGWEVKPEVQPPSELRVGVRSMFRCLNTCRSRGRCYLIVTTTFHTHCARVSIQIRANIIILVFFINSMYNIKPLIMFRSFGLIGLSSVNNNVKILRRLVHCYVVKHFCEHTKNSWDTKTIKYKYKYKCIQLSVLKEANKTHLPASVVPRWTKSVNVVAVLPDFVQLVLGNSFLACFSYIQTPQRSLTGWGLAT